MKPQKQSSFYASRPQIDRAKSGQLLGGYAAVCDAPFIAFAPELIEVYPVAMVVLVERDIKAWYKSFDSAIVASIPSYGPSPILTSDSYTKLVER